LSIEFEQYREVFFRLGGPEPFETSLEYTIYPKASSEHAPARQITSHGQCAMKATRLKERMVNFQKVEEKVWFEFYDEFENGNRVDDMIED